MNRRIALRSLYRIAKNLIAVENKVNPKLLKIKSPATAYNWLLNTLSPVLKGLKRDKAWENIRKVEKAIQDTGVNLEHGKVDSSDYRIDGGSKRYDYTVSFKNVDGNTIILDLYLLAYAAGPLNDPWDAYDLIFSLRQGKLKKASIEIRGNKKIAANVANQPGKYTNFTGKIDWKGNDGQVKNADFELTNNNGIIWEKGVWQKGIWVHGTWKNGIWESGKMNESPWENGTWKNGTAFGVIWKNGTWENGINYSSTWYNGIWKNGAWKGGWWKDGIWKNGTWESGYWYGGKWEKGTADSIIWYDGTWKNGILKEGLWKGGTWENGVWNDGTWKGGTWKNGTWKHGEDKDKKEHGKGDSPDKW